MLTFRYILEMSISIKLTNLGFVVVLLSLHYWLSLVSVFHLTYVYYF